MLFLPKDKIFKCSEKERCKCFQRLTHVTCSECFWHYFFPETRFQNVQKKKKDSNVFQTFLIAISQLFIPSGNELSHNQTYTIFFVTYDVMNIMVLIVLCSRLPWTWKTQLLTLLKFAHLAMRRKSTHSAHSS